MSEAMSRSDYWAEVRSLAETIAADAAERGEEVSDVLHETIDGHAWVIYTSYNFDVLRWSENDSYTAENFGADVVMNCDGSMNWAALAFGALYADVAEEMSKAGAL